MHQRQLIRETVRNLLLSQTDAKSRIYTNRYQPIFEMELPCILIYTRSETATPYMESPFELKRQ